VRRAERRFWIALGIAALVAVIFGVEWLLPAIVQLYTS
jgi:hypothetical protein